MRSRSLHGLAAIALLAALLQPCLACAVPQLGQRMEAVGCHDAHSAAATCPAISTVPITAVQAAPDSGLAPAFSPALAPEWTLVPAGSSSTPSAEALTPPGSRLSLWLRHGSLRI